MGLQGNSEDTLDVSGTLTFGTVPGVYQDAKALLNAGIRTIDLEGVSTVDSSGLALMLEWQSEATARGSQLSFINAPSDLLRLAALSDSTGLLGLQARSVAGGEN